MGMKNTDPNYGDNTVCDVCEDFLDFGFNLKPNAKNGGKWVCVRCVDYLIKRGKGYEKYQTFCE